MNTAAKTAHVTILASDDAFGVIRFAPESLSRTAREGPGSSILLTIQRSEGLLGPATVYWAVYGAGASDLETTSGSVTLETGSNATRIVLRVTEDQVCDLVFVLKQWNCLTLSLILMQLAVRVRRWNVKHWKTESELLR